jgi:hypothetical protein
MVVNSYPTFYFHILKNNYQIWANGKQKKVNLWLKYGCHPLVIQLVIDVQSQAHV